MENTFREFLDPRHVSVLYMCTEYRGSYHGGGIE